MSRTNLAVLAALVFAAGCRDSHAPGHDRTAGEEHRHGTPAAAGAAAATGDDAVHDHGDEEVSDLDLPAETLLAKACEHDRKAFECDECRYEVGVARVPKALLDDGLVKTTVVIRRKVEAPISLTGEIGFDERRVAHVAASTEARVRSVRAGLGERVRAGQPLVELESVALGEAQSQLLEALGALDLARRGAERAEGLREERIASEREWLQARQEHEAAGIRARAAREKLVRLGLTEGEVEALTARGGAAGRGVLVLRAPVAGVVLEMHAVPGEWLRPEEAVATVGALSDLWLWADLYEDHLGRVLAAEASRLRAAVAVKAFPGEVFPGTVDFVGPTMDERTRTVKVRIAVKNPSGKLRAGMFAMVELFLPGEEEGLAVPRAAVLSDEGRSFVFVHQQGDYWMRRPIEIGRASLDWIEVRVGLAGGERIVADGAFLLKSDVLRSKMGAGCAD